MNMATEKATLLRPRLSRRRRLRRASTDMVAAMKRRRSYHHRWRRQRPRNTDMVMVTERRHRLPSHRLLYSFRHQLHNLPCRNSMDTATVNRRTPARPPDLLDKRRRKERDTTNAKTTHPLGDRDAPLRGRL